MNKELGFSESTPDVLQKVDTFEDGEIVFSVFKEYLSDGRWRLYFVESSEEESFVPLRKNRGVTSVGYRIFGEHDAMLLGFKVSEKYSGRGLGKKLVNYFLEFVKKEKLTFRGTGDINKPMIALTLSRMGFEPASRDVLVEILPRSMSTPSERVPNVQVLRNEENKKLITGSEGGLFYRKISPEEVLKKYPISSPDMIVAVQTHYFLPEKTESN
jgi:GNAT superfamily N-acetyltransferase